MSKKDRLKKEKEKQLLSQKKEELAERELAENFKESKSVKKYKNKKPAEPKFFLVSKLLMLVPLGWSGFWGGVMSIAIVLNLVNDFEFSQFTKKTALLIVGGVLIMAIALVLEFLRKYLSGFVVSVVGAIVYIKGINQFVNPIDKYLETHLVDSLEGYTDLWKIRCYPMWACVVISAVTFAVAVILKLVEKKKVKQKQDNAPVKSIVSD